MKNSLKYAGLIVLLLVLLCPPVGAQSFIKKFKQKAEDATLDKIFEDKNSSGTSSGNNVYSGDRTGSPSNTRGGGLTSEDIDVPEQISLAENSFAGKQYGDSRYSVRQAIMGIELEIGQHILDGLPESIAGLPAVAEEDRVTSSGIGFAGLVIQRVYRENDREFRVAVGNDAVMLSAGSMYLASGAYGTTDQDENMKKTRFQDERAVIRYDDYSGYELSVPFGQSSILVTKGINFDNEEAFMSASDKVDLHSIKIQLGEQ